MVLGLLVALRIALDSVFVHGLCSLVHAEVFEGLGLVERSLVNQVECGVLGLDLTEGIGSFEELTVQVQTHCGAVVVFRLDLQAAVAFFADFLFTGVTEARSNLHGPDEATVLLGVEVVVRHLEVKREVAEDAHVLDVHSRTGDEVAFLGEAATHAQVRREVVGQGEARFQVEAFTAFRIAMENVDEGELDLRFEAPVEATVEEGEVQVGRNDVSVIAVGTEESRNNERKGTVTILGAHARLNDVLQGDTHEEVAELGRSERVEADTDVGTDGQLLHVIELVDVKHGEVDTQRDELEQVVGVAEHEGIFAVGLAAVNGGAVFEERETESMLVIHREGQAYVFLASLATDGAKECRTEFELVGFRDARRVHVHGRVAAEFGKPVVLLILVRSVGGFCKQRARSHSKSED